MNIDEYTHGDYLVVSRTTVSCYCDCMACEEVRQEHLVYLTLITFNFNLEIISLCKFVRVTVTVLPHKF